MFAYFTLFTYLMVGTFAVRLLMPEMTSVEVSQSYFQLFKKYEINSQIAEEIVAPEMAFQEIKFPEVKKPIVVAKAPVKKVAPSVVPESEMKLEKVVKNELPFHEPVELKPVVMENDLPQNYASLYVEFKYEMVAEALPVQDEVSTVLAATSDAEPEFFEYSVAKPTPKKEEAPASSGITKIENDPIEDNHTSIAAAAAPQTEVILGEEVPVSDLIAFDYSKAEQDLKQETIPTVTKMTTQGLPASPGQAFEHAKWEVHGKSKKSSKVTTHQETNPYINKNKGLTPGPAPEHHKKYPNRVTIQLSGTNLKEIREEMGFEVRFQDDLNETYQDYNNGSITIDQELSNPKMTRSMVVLKRGYAPTNTDLILEEGVSEIFLPVIEEGTFNELLGPYESRGPIGAVLIELDESVEEANLDVPYSQVLKLDGDMKVTEAPDFRYQLFVGVKAGNALLSYKESNGEVTSKIIHVHEHELTFETNFFEPVINEKIKLLEEDLLSKDKTSLIISSQEVRQFATDKTSRKLNNHTYKMNFNKTLLGSRKYLELTHQEEPIFVGVKAKDTVVVPSENFMRYILSRFEGAKLGNRCLVQVNLSKMAVKVDVAAESVGQSLMTYTQVLDSDGKFYDSIGAKSRKVIIVGENQSAPGISQDSKINIKITYADDTVQFLGSYCSPNTYLVEQL